MLMTQRIVFGCGRRQKQKTSSSAINAQLILLQSNKSGERRKITIQRAQSRFATAFSVNKSRESRFCGSKSQFRVRSRTKVVATGLFATFSPCAAGSINFLRSMKCSFWFPLLESIFDWFLSAALKEGGRGTAWSRRYATAFLQL